MRAQKACLFRSTTQKRKLSLISEKLWRRCSMGRKHGNIELPKLTKVSAFFSSHATPSEIGITHYPIDQLRPNSSQPRKFFDDIELKQLSESIKHCGVLE